MRECPRTTKTVATARWQLREETQVSHGAPLVFPGKLVWTDSRLYLRRWVDVTLVPVPPTRHLFPDRTDCFLLEDMRYGIKEINRHDIRLRIPFIDYEEFQKTRAWSDGFTYYKYMRVLLKSFACQRPYHRRILEKACKDAESGKRLPLWYIPEEEQDVSGYQLPVT